MKKRFQISRGLWVLALPWSVSLCLFLSCLPAQDSTVGAKIHPSGGDSMVEGGSGPATADSFQGIIRGYHFVPEGQDSTGEVNGRLYDAVLVESDSKLHMLPTPESSTNEGKVVDLLTKLTIDKTSTLSVLQSNHPFESIDGADPKRDRIVVEKCFTKDVETMRKANGGALVELDEKGRFYLAVIDSQNEVEYPFQLAEVTASPGFRVYTWKKDSTTVGLMVNTDYNSCNWRVSTVKMVQMGVSINTNNISRFTVH